MKHSYRIRSVTLVTVIMATALLFTDKMTLAQTVEEGWANFYSDNFHGKKMSNGELYDKDKLTASHKKYPFGTKVKVTNLENKKSVVVTVTDRMAPKNPAVIDVTRRAAEELDFIKSGKVKVKVEPEK